MYYLVLDNNRVLYSQNYLRYFYTNELVTLWKSSLNIPFVYLGREIYIFSNAITVFTR